MFYCWPVCLKLLENESISYFELDPDHYVSTAGYIWDTMLRFTVVNLS